MQNVAFITEDNVTIVGDYYPNESQSAPAVILLHMMPLARESWRDFAPVLVGRGFQVLAIDERGHGESTRQGDTTLDYKSFTDAQQQAKMLDVMASRKFFEERGVEPEHIFVGGASIGANLAIQYLAEHSEARAGFALSAGHNYKGIETKPLMAKLRESQSIFLSAAEDDPNVSNSAQATKGLARVGLAQKELKIFETGGHGTDMFKVHPELMEELAGWLARHI